MRHRITAIACVSQKNKNGSRLTASGESLAKPDNELPWRCNVIIARAARRVKRTEKCIHVMKEEKRLAATKKTPGTAALAAIYARYSSAAQNDASIEQQVEECRQYASANGLTIVAVYEDRAKSGRSDNRPGFQKMLRAAERGEFQVLLAYKSNRISRNMQSALTYEQRLSDAGVRVVYCREEFGDNATGRFMLRMMMNMNQFYSENMSEDIRRGMADSASKGRVTGTVPFGYRKDANGMYAIDEPAAAIVREIFHRTLNGESLADIRRDFNRRGLKTRLNRPWSKNSFHCILTNEKYTGSFNFGELRIENAIPVIIDKEVYDMMQKKLNGDRIVRKRHRGGNDYLLTGKLYCGYCLAPMVGMSGRSRHDRNYYYYACQTRRTKNACKKEHVRKEDIEAQVVRIVQQNILDDRTIEWIAENIMQTARSFQAQSLLTEYESELRDIRKQITNVVNAIALGVAGDEIKDRMDELQEDKRRLEGLIAIEKIATKNYDKTSIVGYIETIRHGDPTDPAFQKIVIRDFIKAVYLYDDHLKLIIDFTGKNQSVELPYTAPTPPEIDPIECFAQRLIKCTIKALKIFFSALLIL